LEGKVVEVDAAEQLKTVAAQVIADPDQLAAFLAVADANRVADAEGNIDVEKVGTHLRTLFGVQQPEQRPRQWGQSSVAGGPARQPGDNARAEIAKRYGVEHPRPAPIERHGDNARAELKKRYGVNKTSR
jgi:hypothetical protein